MRETEERKYNLTKKASELPDSIDEVTDEILEEVIQCEHHETGNHSFGCDVNCATAFRITRQELDFYRLSKLPLPRLCFNCRHVDRVKWRNLPVLHHRQCMCKEKNHEHKSRCEVEFETTYPPEGSEIIYCEKCYQQEVY